MVRRNIELEARLIDDLLDLTRITRGKLSLNLAPVDLKRLVDDCAATVMELRGKRIDFAMEWGAEESWVSGDRSRLMQVFWNVLKNAAKFTPAGGQVTVRASQRNGDGTGTGPWLAVECEDTGVGIAPEVLPQIFTAVEQGGPGITRQFGGLGLGLAISRALVEAHGGSIRAHSEGLGKGATFTVCLPAVPTPERGGESLAPAAPAMQANAKSENGSSALHILLVEDHADTAEILSRRLRRLGHKVTHAESVAQALACAADAQAGRNGGRIDLVVSDLGLPDGTGYDLMRQLSAEHGLRGIAVSGFGMEEDLRRSAEAGFARHFTKPVDFARLAGIIQELAEGRDG
jgi:CheY-like chemotaxis protein